MKLSTGWTVQKTIMFFTVILLCGCGGDDPFSSKQMAGFYDLIEVRIDLGRGNEDVRVRDESQENPDVSGFITLQASSTFELFAGYGGPYGGIFGSSGDYETRSSGSGIDFNPISGPDFSGSLSMDRETITVTQTLNTVPVTMKFVKKF